MQTKTAGEEYQTLDEDTFISLASTVNTLISSSSQQFNQDIALEVTNKLFNEGINRLAGSMQSGVFGSAVKQFDFENFKMEVQKKTKQEF